MLIFAAGRGAPTSLLVSHMSPISHTSNSAAPPSRPGPAAPRPRSAQAVLLTGEVAAGLSISIVLSCFEATPRCARAGAQLAGVDGAGDSLDLCHAMTVAWRGTGR
jgi:hypothetical protein